MRSAPLLVMVVILGGFPVNAGAAQLSGEELLAGRKLYVSKCAKCHKFHEPKNYADSDWSLWMSKMSRKSRLKPDQEQLLTRYLEAYRKGEVSAAK